MQNTDTNLPNLTRRTVLATVMVGIALTFILIEKEPGWQPFLAGGLLAIGFLLASLAVWASSEWLELLALAVLLLAMLWDREKPMGAVVGIALVTLNILQTHGNILAATEGESLDQSEENSLEGLG